MRCPMECREGAELVLAYCTRRLEPEKAEWFERHLKDCASCRETTMAQKSVWEALDYWEALPVSEDFDRRLRARIRTEEQKTWIERLPALGLTGWLRPALPIASVAVFALAMFLVRTPRAGLPEPQAHLDSAEVEQTERALEDLEMIRQFTLPAREASPHNPI
ncbi:MAG: hypothetical protein HY822_08090 [Acidobacteria bacterium]|nr:hypothetical protein [Acidobacteriota bacterium]